MCLGGTSRACLLAAHLVLEHLGLHPLVTVADVDGDAARPRGGAVQRAPARGTGVAPWINGTAPPRAELPTYTESLLSQDRAGHIQTVITLRYVFLNCSFRCDLPMRRPTSSFPQSQPRFLAWVV